MDIGTDYAGVALGGMLHNFIAQTKGFLSKQFAVGPMQFTQLGLLSLAVGVLGEKFGYIKQNGFLSQILKGMFGEGWNVPAVESTTRTTAGGTTGPGGAGYVPGYPMIQAIGPGNAQGYVSPMAGPSGAMAVPVVGPYYTPPWYGY